MKKKLNKEFLIGLSVIVAIIILIFGIDFLKGINLFKPSNFYVANYENVAGLEMAAPITIDGYKVGQVREIKFNYENPGKIEVVMALDKNLRLPKDSKATIGTSLLGGAFIEIQLGKSADKLEVGGEIATASKPDLMGSLSDEIMPSVTAILPKVDSILSNLNRISGDPALLQSLKRIDGITADLQSLAANLTASANREVPYLLRNTRSATETLDSITDNLAVLSAQLKALPIETTFDNVNATTEQLKTFTTQLNNPNSTLTKLTSDPKLYNDLTNVTSDLDSLIVDIKKNPKRYISIKLL